MSDRRQWDDLRNELARVVFKDGVVAVAGRLPAHRATVYRLINGQTTKPSGSLRDAVEKVVASATPGDSKVPG